MVVTDGTAGCEPHPCLHRRTGAIDGVTIQPFFRNGSAFTCCHVAAIKSGRDELILSRLRQQIARELPFRELVKRQILIEGFHNPVTIRPHLTFIVQMQTVSVSVACDIQPLPCLFFPEMRRRQISIHHFLIRIGGGIVEVVVHFRNLRRQSCQRKSHAANECSTVRLTLRREFLLFQFCQYECIDRILHPSGCLDFRNLL